LVARSLAFAHANEPFASEYFPVIFSGCVSCHTSGGGSNGGLAPGFDEDRWYSQLVNAKATAADGSGKLRVHPYLPWNSFLVDKLSGDVKTFEGVPMPANDSVGSSGSALWSNCPGDADALYNWILGGAKREWPKDASGQEDHRSMELGCTKPQPPFPSIPAAAAGVIRLAPPPFDLAGAREREQPYAFGGEFPTDTWVRTIEIWASAGTEYVAISRSEGETPFAVARGQDDPTKPRIRQTMAGWADQYVHVRIELPDGVALKIPAGPALQLRHLLRNDYWRDDATFANVTEGRVVIDLHSVSGEGVAEANPFLDETGTMTMFVPPQGIGVSGGVWTAEPGTPVNGAVVGIWTDKRAVEAALVDPAGQAVAIGNVATCEGVASCPSENITRGYVNVTDVGLPAGAIAYQCAHSNGLSNNIRGDLAAATSLANNPAVQITSRPMKWGCAETAQVPGGTPGLVGAAAKDCAVGWGTTAFQPNECRGTGVSQCRPANLVGGTGVNDGRCSLIGLWW
jgi:hypothetical protein